MKKFCQILLAGFVFLISLAPLTVAQAKVDFVAEETLTLSGVYEDDMMAAGAFVTGQTTVNGDAFVAGNDINIGGVYNDDLNVAGSQVKVSGVVQDNLRVAGGSVSIDAQVNGNVMVAGGQITIGKDAVIDGDLLVAGGVVIVDGEVKGDVKISGGQVILGGDFKGNLKIDSEEFEVTDSALIEGDLSYTAREKLENIGGRILGEVDFSQWEEPAKKAMAGVGILQRIWDFIVGLLMMFVVGMVIVLLTPQTAEVVVKNYAKNIWMSLLYGIIALIVVPIVGFILLFTLVGLPLGLILWVLYGVALYLGVVFAGLTVGSLILNRVDLKWTSMLLSLALGVFLLQLIQVIPLVGGLVFFILMLVGFGSIIYSLIHREKKETVEPAVKAVKAEVKGKVKGKK